MAPPSPIYWATPSVGRFSPQVTSAGQQGGSDGLRTWQPLLCAPPHHLFKVFELGVRGAVTPVLQDSVRPPHFHLFPKTEVTNRTEEPQQLSGPAWSSRTFRMQRITGGRKALHGPHLSTPVPCPTQTPPSLPGFSCLSNGNSVQTQRCCEYKLWPGF